MECDMTCRIPGVIEMIAAIWLNSRWQRILAWVFRWSPSLWRAPTFREAWSGRVDRWLT